MIGEELFIGVGDQIHEFLLACAVGVGIGVAYELMRFIRCMISHGDGAVLFEDIAFCFTTAMISFNLWLGVSDGRPRGYLIAGELIGACMYFFTFGYWLKPFRKTLGRLSKHASIVLRKMLCRLFSVLYSPFSAAAKRARLSVVLYRKRLRSGRKAAIEHRVHRLREKTRIFAQKKHR